MLSISESQQDLSTTVCLVLLTIQSFSTDILYLNCYRDSEGTSSLQNSKSASATESDSSRLGSSMTPTNQSNFFEHLNYAVVINS